MKVSDRTLELFKLYRKRQAYRITRKMIRQAIRKGEQKIQTEVWGELAKEVWLDLGWKPYHETWNRDIGGHIMVIEMDVPDIPWD